MTPTLKLAAFLNLAQMASQQAEADLGSLPSPEPACGAHDAILAAGSFFESVSGEGLAGSDAAALKLTDIPAAPAHGGAA